MINPITGLADDRAPRSEWEECVRSNEWDWERAEPRHPEEWPELVEDEEQEDADWTAEEER